MNGLSNDDLILALLTEDQSSYYRLLMVISSLDNLKVRILLVLSHLHPRRLSATDLSMLLGYSKKSRTLYRGVLDELEEEMYILIERLNKKHFSIQLNVKHPLMQELIELSVNEGENYSAQLFENLEVYRE